MAISNTIELQEEFLLSGGLLICVSFQNLILFSFMITWLCQPGKSVTLCSREQIIRKEREKG